MASMDVFNQKAFDLVSLTDAINKSKHVPGRLEQLGIFLRSSVSTTSIMIEEANGILALVSPTPRGGPGETLDKDRRTVRSLRIPHIQIDDSVMADEVQSVRTFGSETELQTVQGIVGERLMIHSQSLAATEEYLRVGAVKGIVTYPDSTQMNLFTEFGVTAIAEKDWDLDNGSPVDGILRKTAAETIRTIANELDGVPFQGVHAICGDTFFDQLVNHKEIRNTFLAQEGASELRTSYVQAGMSFGSFNFGGITWENYRGSVGGQAYVEAGKCHIFPVGVPGLFRSVYGPADYVETVNTMGQQRYAKQWPLPNGKGVRLESQTNVIHYCTRPRVLLKGKNT